MKNLLYIVMTVIMATSFAQAAGGGGVGGTNAMGTVATPGQINDLSSDIEAMINDPAGANLKQNFDGVLLCTNTFCPYSWVNPDDRELNDFQERLFQPIYREKLTQKHGTKEHLLFYYRPLFSLPKEGSAGKKIADFYYTPPNLKYAVRAEVFKKDAIYIFRGVAAVDPRTNLKIGEFNPKRIIFWAAYDSKNRLLVRQQSDMMYASGLWNDRARFALLEGDEDLAKLSAQEKNKIKAQQARELDLKARMMPMQARSQAQAMAKIEECSEAAFIPRYYAPEYATERFMEMLERESLEKQAIAGMAASMGMSISPAEIEANFTEYGKVKKPEVKAMMEKLFKMWTGQSMLHLPYQFGGHASYSIAIYTVKPTLANLIEKTMPTLKSETLFLQNFQSDQKREITDKYGLDLEKDYQLATLGALTAELAFSNEVGGNMNGPVMQKWLGGVSTATLGSTVKKATKLIGMKGLSPDLGEMSVEEYGLKVLTKLVDPEEQKRMSNYQDMPAYLLQEAK